MTITITAFERSPDGGKGLARDMRVRWALEEVGQPYNVRLLSFEAMKEPAYLAFQPFGQIPIYEDGNLVLFESGAIVLHIAQHHSGLLPEDTNGRARAITWIFAALTTMEPVIVELEAAEYLEGEEAWYEQRVPLIRKRIHQRLGELSARLGDAEWLDGQFSAGDLLMISALSRAEGTGLLEDYPNLCTYIARGQLRAPYRRAFAAQLTVFKAASRD